jgi:hypothetical protein
MTRLTRTLTAVLALGTLSLSAVAPASAQYFGSNNMSQQQRQYQQRNGWTNGSYFGMPNNNSQRTQWGGRRNTSNYRNSNGHSGGNYFGF